MMFEKYREIIPDFDGFIEAVKNFNLVSIRVNVLKTTTDEIVERLGERFGLERVEWYSSALVVNKDKENIARTLEFALGFIYTQRLESMVPALVLEPKESELILDMCAAPGSKTTQIAEMLRNRGRIVANDINEKRLRALFSNIEKQGVMNVSVTKYDGRRYPDTVLFDKVLVDAPCTGEGREFKERKMWESKKLCKKQFKLLKRAVEVTKSNGIVVYSTCTLNPIENEWVVNRLLERVDNLKLEKIKIKGLKAEKGVEEFKRFKFSSEVRKCIRLYPHISNTGGFFVARIRVL